MSQRTFAACRDPRGESAALRLATQVTVMCLAWSYAGFSATAADLPPPPPFSSPPPDRSITNAPVREISPGILEVGRARLNQQQRTVTFPAVVNMRSPPIEYFVVTSYGRTHESILRTEAQPIHIHTAMLLLGAKGAGPNEWPKPDDLDASIPGDKVSILVSWKEGETEIRRPAEELMFNLATQSVASKSHWVFNGSGLVDGVYEAQREGGVVSVITEPSAMINNPRAGRENDEIWTVNTNALPAVGTPVQVTIKLESSTSRRVESTDSSRN